MSESSNNSMETVSFRRFLSYIYAYEDDTKLRNVGFAKVEVRPPRVRFQVTVNGILQKGGRPMELCLVDKNLQRIPVGQLILQNGRGDYRGSTGLENMWDSGLAFSQVYGICLQGAGNRRHYYMTLWREAARPVRSVSCSEDNRIIIIPQDKEKREEHNETGNQSEHVKPEKVKSESIKSESIKSESMKSESIIEAAEVASGAETAEEGEKEEAEGIEKEEAGAVEGGGMEKAEAGTDEGGGMEEAEAGTDEEEALEKAEAETAEEYQEELESASELVRQQSADEILRKADADDSAASSIPGQRTRRQNIKERNGDKCLEMWKRFCTRYPHVDIRPLEPDNGKTGDSFLRMGKVCEVIRIRPNDIGRLPRNNWILAHNSFLQNAYNHYHQLILFRVENQGINNHPENRWYIGLPGENTEQETLVADVFGFKKYLKCRNGGFWYTEIMLG
ncbi:MAG: hypothetical protein ACI4D3_08750 [Lachnospiraceae bacterium]